jgi:hypothetical protein
VLDIILGYHAEGRWGTMGWGVIARQVTDLHDPALRAWFKGQPLSASSPISVAHCPASRLMPRRIVHPPRPRSKLAGEAAADHRPDLRHLARRAEPIEPRHQRLLQRRRYRLRKAGKLALIEGHAIDAQRTSLELARAGLEDLLAISVLLPASVAPKLLRDRAKDRLGIGELPLCHYERCGRYKLIHRLSPYLPGGFTLLAASKRAGAK